MGWFPILCLFFQVIGAFPPAVSKIYRTDYVYNKKTDAFYKLHIDSASLHRANELCSLEGTKLLTPENGWDLIQIHAMIKKYPDIDSIWIGDDGKPHMETEKEENVVVFGSTPPDYEDSARSEEEEKCDLINKFGEVTTLKHHFCRYGLFTHPFICKIEAKDAPYDEICDVYELGYKYESTVGSCYKISEGALPWNAAYDECQAVGSHLVVINSEAEHLIVKKLLENSKPVHTSHHSLYLSAGFRAKAGTREFVTIFNQTLEEAGYAEWSENEPNNFNNNEYCGSLAKFDGKLNDFSCGDSYAFICEKEKRQ